jgi:hypothetical protein
LRCVRPATWSRRARASGQLPRALFRRAARDHRRRSRS